MGLPPARRPNGFQLTSDDVVLLAGMAAGSTDTAIGRQLDPVLPLSVDAVRGRVAMLRRRMGARNRPHMVALGMQWGFLRRSTTRSIPRVPTVKEAGS